MGKGCSSLISGILLLFGLFFILRDCGLIDENKNPSQYSSSKHEESVKTPSPKDIALPLVKITNFNWHKGGFDNIMIADFTIENNSKYDVKDLTIECVHFAKSGTKIDSNTRTIYDVIKAGKQKRFKKFNMGFVHDQAEKSFPKVINLAISD